MVKSLKYWNIIFFISMISINIIANTLPFGRGSTAEISAKYHSLFTPAPLTFSIWFVIYLLLGYFIVYQLGVFNEVFANTFVSLIGPWFIISCILNIGWLFSFSYEKTFLSMLFMIGLLLSLAIISFRLSPENVMLTAMEPHIPLFAKICLYTFDLYFGWIVAATIANMSVLLLKLNWNIFNLSEQFFTVIVLIGGTVLGMLFVIFSNRFMSSLAIIWAYCGILVNHISRSGYAGAYPVIIFVTILGIFLILISGIIKELILMTDIG